jgi:6-phosphogluconolactonase
MPLLIRHLRTAAGSFAFSFLFCLWIGEPQLHGAESFVYVSLAGEEKIAVYPLADGRLGSQIERIVVAGSPGSSVFDSRRRMLYVAVRGEGKLVGFQVGADGRLTLHSSVAVSEDPSFIAIEPGGRYLLTSYYRAGKAAVHPLDAAGKILADPRWYSTDEKAHAIAIDPTNQFVLVPHTGPNAIFQFRWNAQQGTLTPCEPDRIRTGEMTGPRHAAFHHNLPVVYADNEQGSSVSAFRFNRETGQLQVTQTMSTLPADFKGNNSCARLFISSDSRFLYAANRGHHSIAGFRIAEDGSLTSIGQFPTEEVPRGFTMTTNDRQLIVAGQAANRLRVYDVAEDGNLTSQQTVVTGGRPWWVTSITLP